jgi:phosphohistidine phosphatase SixA
MGRLAMTSLAFCILLDSNPGWSLTAELANRLRQGGYVLVMRHASSPAARPGKGTADPQNVNLERQLDQKGRATAQAMGRALRSRHIPVGAVYASPAYRARETVRLIGFPAPRTVAELGDQGQSMARIKGPGPAAWLRAAVARKPAPGRNTLLVTHMPNITAAFPAQAAGLQDGETIMFQPDGHGGARPIARIPIQDWSR